MLDRLFLWASREAGKERKAREGAEVSAIQEENLRGKEKEQVVVMLLAMFLKIGLTLGQWMVISQRDKEGLLDGMAFTHLSRPHGLHVLKRVLDDAPLPHLLKELRQLR